MGKNLYFDYAAIVLEFVLLICILLRRMNKGRLNSVFVFLVITALSTTSMDIFAVAFDAHSGYIPEKIFFHTAYLLLRAFTSFFYLSYVIVITETWFLASNTWVKKVLLLLPITIVSGFIISNLVTGKVFYLDENTNYTRGDSFFWLYIFNAYYVLYGILKTIQFRRYMELERIFSMLASMGFIVAAAAAQYYMPNLLIDMFAAAIGLLLIFMLVHRPYEIIDVDTGLIHTTSYVRDMRRSLDCKKPELVLMINITNFQVLREMLGYTDTAVLKRSIADDISSYVKSKRIKAEVYYTGTGCYRIRYMSVDVPAIEEHAEFFNELFKNKHEFSGLQVNAVACVCIASMPEDIPDMAALSAFETGLNSEYTGNVLYSSDICRKVRYDLIRDMDSIIENALSESEFEVYYQPIWSTQKKRYTCAEALIRLNTRKYGSISPELFIPAAEKSGAINRIGDYVSHSVFEFISSDDFSELGLDYIEINLSPVQCLTNGYADELVSEMKELGIEPDKINLEITESASFEHHSAVMQNINKLHDAGVSLSLDDFGTGYSNMTRIASMPFSIIKIDKSLTDVRKNPNLQIVLVNVVKMIKALGMKIVVEGIENEESVRMFDNMGCEYIQGFYYSKALPKSELIDFVKDRRNKQR